MFGSSEKRVVSFDAILCMLRGSLTEAYSVSVSFILLLILTMPENLNVFYVHRIYYES